MLTQDYRDRPDNDWCPKHTLVFAAMALATNDNESNGALDDNATLAANVF